MLCPFALSALLPTLLASSFRENALLPPFWSPLMVTRTFRKKATDRATGDLQDATPNRAGNRA